MYGPDLTALFLGMPTLEERLTEARSMLRTTRELADEIADAAAGLPAAMCTSWRSEASAIYVTRLAELGIEVRQAHSRLESAAPDIERLIRELESARDAAAARVAAIQTGDWHGTGRGAWVS